MVNMYGQDAIPFEASAFKEITNEALCRLKSKNWYKEKVREYADRYLRYEILNEAQKGRDELAIDIKEICRWIKEVIPEYVICDTKSENITQSMDCIDKAIRDCFHDYMEEAGFTFALIEGIDGRKEYIRW